jgi:hypothetical protein
MNGVDDEKVKGENFLSYKLSVWRLVAYASIFTMIELIYHTISSVPLTSEYATLSIIGGLLTAILVGILFQNLPFGPVPRLTLVWLFLFIVQMFADLIEGVFFTTRISSPAIFLGGILLSILITFPESLTGLLLFPATSPPSPLRLTLCKNLRGRQWLPHFVLGSVAYLPIYFLFGVLVSPIVTPFYTDPSLGLGLRIPSFPVMMSIELLRGLLFALALIPIIISIRLSRTGTWLLVALSLYVVGAYVPFVAGTTLPWALKFFHSLEIFADSLVYGGVCTYLFKVQ